MKKLTLTTICAFAAAGVAFAQGYINWSGVGSTATMSAQTNTADSPLFGGSGSGGTVGYTGTAANGFYYELLMSSSGTTATLADLLAWTDTGLTGVNQTSTASGYGGVTPVPPNTAAQVSGAPAGTAVNWVVVGWSANLGTTWGAASNELANWSYSMPGAYFGMTSVGNTAPGSSQFFGATLFGPNAGQINSPNTQLYALPVPEPGTLALAGLGGLSMLLFRRRNRKS